MIKVESTVNVNISLDLELEVHFQDRTCGEDVQDFLRQALDNFFQSHIKDIKAIPHVDEFKVTYVSNDVSLGGLKFSSLNRDADDVADDRRKEIKMERNSE